ncbi:hypothetical protein NHX12_022771 [Muraenolepis orangiensis]|uniref:Uncharacterized protein n=1 Tax=Muraenolepis orangiensis TaxID=630683 RepID=A0A9Q0ENV9_9TELE|nr:hypothetical protein NHX12_022771 [Muraenolepis orangiensis]
MASLMLGVLVLGNLPSRLTAQGGLRFDSVDYKNVLRWTAPLSNTSLNYSVEWKIYGESLWGEAQGCQGIQRLQCDLSKATSNTREWYYARVHASSVLPASRSAWSLSRRFSPRWDTKMSPPKLNMSITEEGIVVRLTPPPALVKKLHKKLCCSIHVLHSSGQEDKYEKRSCTEQLVLDQLSAGTRYCVQAQCVVCLQGKSSTRGPPTCATTP